MGFSILDYAIVAVYLLGITVIGMYIGRKQRSSKDYFLGGKEMSWWSVGFSIVASETSTLTFISIPGLAYKSNMHFLQLAAGYFLGRMLVSLIFIPAYYKGDLETAYDFLGKRFGMSLRKFTSTVFIVTRVLASGVRLFATAIPVHLITGYDYATSILIIGIFTLIYTYVGGLKAVVAMDVVQMFIYLGGAVASMMLILNHLPNGWSDVVSFATQNGNNKFSMLNLTTGNSLMEFLSSPYTVLGGLLGGTFLSMASHGTDQLLVQRLLGCKSTRDSQRALMLDATVIVLQFAFFLILGLCLYAFYEGAPFQQLGLTSSDEIFPKFIVENLPTGIAGLVVAGVLASAMGTLSSSISSLASSTFLDIFKFTAKGKNLDAQTEVKWSKRFTLLWGILLIGGAMLFTDSKN
ncbi:MAG: sodium:solute symporter, partial [Bacteroidota bacterium]